MVELIDECVETVVFLDFIEDVEAAVEEDHVREDME